MKPLLARLRSEPAAYLTSGLGAIAALVIAFGHLPTISQGIIAGAATALATAITAILARPRDYAAISGSAAILIQSLVLFNVHWSTGEVAAIIGGINVVLGMMAMRPALTPVVNQPAPSAAAGHP